jgi:DNA-binding transcriptional LysR family regulator
MLPVAVTSEVAEFAAAPLIDAFVRRAPRVEATLQIEDPGTVADLLADHVVDAALGPRPLPDPRRALESVPFLRYRMIVVAAPGHWLAGQKAVAPAALAGERWLVGPSGAAPRSSDVGDFLERWSLAPDDIEAFPSFAATAHAAAAGRGVMLAVAHTVMDDLRRGTLVRLDVRGTPIEEMWHCSTLASDRRSPAATALRRFVSTPEAVQAVLARAGGVPAERYRPPVHVTLWQS